MKGKIVYLALALVLVFSLAAVVVPASPAQAQAIWYVDDDNCPGPGTGTVGDPFCKIQHAIGNASPGDTINVAAGTYNEAVSIPSGKDGLEIAGTNAIVDGTGLGDVNGFSIASDNVKIHGFTIQNFIVSVQGPTTNMKGWGIITVAGTSGGELYDNTITSASGGIYILASTNYEVYDNNINNIAGDFPYHGHGIIVYSSGPAQGAISGNIIGKLGHPNTISDTDVATPGYFGCGQGIYVGSDNELTLLVNAHGTKVEYNIVSNVKSKAIQVSGVTTASTVDVNHNQISGSKLWGLDIMYCGVVNVNNNTFSGMTDFQVVRASYDAANPGNCLTGEEMYDIFKNNGNTFDKAAAAVVSAGNEINTSLANSNYRYIQSDIQDAIADAHIGDTVEVLAGTYSDEPWLGAPIEEGTAQKIDGGGTMTDTPTGGDVDIDATGVHDVTVVKYTSNPGGPAPFASSGNYWDVHLDNTTGVTSLTIEFCPVSSPTQIYYWDGWLWDLCSDQGYSDGCVVVTVTSSTHPSLSDLSGQGFASGGPPCGVPEFPSGLAGIAAAIAALFVVFALRTRVLSKKR